MGNIYKYKYICGHLPILGNKTLSTKKKNREKTCTDLAEISYIYIYIINAYVTMSHIPTYTVYRFCNVIARRYYIGFPMAYREMYVWVHRLLS